MSSSISLLTNLFRTSQGRGFDPRWPRKEKSLYTAIFVLRGYDV